MTENPKIPTISVVIPVYNRSSSIIAAIESVQRVLNNIAHEILIVDDGSSDQTLKVVNSYAEKNNCLYVFSMEHTGSPAKVRNYGIGKSRGEFIAFHDSDDLWTDHDIQDRLMPFEESKVVMTYANAKYANSKIGKAKVFVPPGTELKNDAFSHLVSRFHSPIPTPTVILRSSLLKSLGGFSEMLTVAEDVNLWIRVSLHGSIRYVPEICAVIGRDGTNISKIESEDGLAGLLAHEEDSIKSLEEIRNENILSKNQKSIVSYRIYEMQAMYDTMRKKTKDLQRYTDAPDHPMPKEIQRLEDEYSHSVAGKAKRLTKILSFGNEKVESSLNRIVSRIIRPFRSYV